MNAQQPVALVTGASSGVGKEVALRLVDAGYHVVGTSRDASAFKGRDLTVEGLSFVDLDVASEAAVAEAVEHVLGRFGRLDVSWSTTPASAPEVPPRSFRSHRTEGSSTSTSSRCG